MKTEDINRKNVKWTIKKFNHDGYATAWFVLNTAIDKLYEVFPESVLMTEIGKKYGSRCV